MADVAASISSYFNSLVSSQMETFRQPLYALQKQRTELNTTRSTYAEVSSKLSSLKDAVDALISTQTDTSLTSGRSIAVTNVASGFNVLSATASSSAITGTYVIDHIVLGKEHRVTSDAMGSPTQALNLKGTFVLGGAADRAVSSPLDALQTTITGFSTGAALSGQPELEGGAYKVETKLNGSTYQFRLVDSHGNAMNIQSGTTGSLTTGWQDIPAGKTYDTGRGLKIDFKSDNFAEGSLNLAYVPQGVSIAVTETDTLNTIANKINAGTFPTGQGVAASVIDGHLILTGTTVGTGHDIIAAEKGTDTVLHSLGILGASGFAHTLQAANTDTTFNVNGQPVTRHQNTGLTDVISGITLNFSQDAEGKSATVAVTPNWTSARSAIGAFVTKFNDVQSYLDTQSAINKNEDDTGKITYSRGPLSDDSSISELRGSLFDALSSANSTGAYKFLSDIGITFDDSLNLKVSDATKLEDALNTNSSNVKSLMDFFMGKVSSMLGSFTGSTSNNNTGYVSNILKSIDTQIKDIGTDITDMTSSLSDRQNSLMDQYAAMQAQLLQMSYDQQAWSSIYGSYSSSG